MQREHQEMQLRLAELAEPSVLPSPLAVSRSPAPSPAPSPGPSPGTEHRRRLILQVFRPMM